MEEATKYAHAMGMTFHEFVCAALKEKLTELRGDEELRNSASKTKWEPLLK